MVFSPLLNIANRGLGLGMVRDKCLLLKAIDCRFEFENQILQNLYIQTYDLLSNMSR